MVGLIGRTAIVDITKLILINVDSGLTVLGRVDRFYGVFY